MKCKNCGADINPGAKYCTNCGAEVADPILSEIHNSKNKESLAKIIVTIIIIFILLCIVGSLMAKKIEDNGKTVIDYSKYFNYKMTKLDKIEYMEKDINYIRKKNLAVFGCEIDLDMEFFIVDNELFFTFEDYNITKKIPIEKPQYLFEYNDNMSCDGTLVMVVTKNNDVYSFDINALGYGEEITENINKYAEIVLNNFKKINGDLKIKDLALREYYSMDEAYHGRLIAKDVNNKIYFGFDFQPETDKSKEEIILYGEKIILEMKANLKIYVYNQVDEFAEEKEYFVLINSDKKPILYKAHFLDESDVLYLIDQDNRLYTINADSNLEKGIAPKNDKKVVAYGKNKEKAIIIFEDGSDYEINLSKE